MNERTAPTPEDLAEAAAQSLVETMEEAFNDYGALEAISDAVAPRLGLADVAAEDLTDEQGEALIDEAERLFYGAVARIVAPFARSFTVAELDILCVALDSYAEAEEELETDDPEYFDAEGVRTARSLQGWAQAELVRLSDPLNRNSDAVVDGPARAASGGRCTEGGRSWATSRPQPRGRCPWPSG